MSSSATPTRIGPYELVARLGVGGMAETYVAMRRGPGAFAQRVCLKRLRPELERDPEFVRQFMAEAAIAARLRHAAIAQVLDFGQHGPDYYLALELVEGCDLRELLQAAGGALPPALVLHVAIELATALDFAHRAGGAPDRAAVVHRDVSPSNTLVSTEGEVKLTDFGIARALGEAKHTSTGIVKGKVPYMAPEYARSARLDPRSDLFSLGVLLYECACGTRPHDGATELETLERASRGQHVRLDQRVPGLAPGFVAIVECLLEPDPELRYQSASEVVEALLLLPSSSRARLDLGARVAALVAARKAKADVASAAAREPATEIMPEPDGAAAQPAAARTRPLPNEALGTTRDHAGEALVAAPARRTFSRPSRGARLALAFAGLCGASVLGVALLRAPAVTPPVASATSAASGTTAVHAARPAPAPAVLTRPDPGTTTGQGTGTGTGSSSTAGPVATGASAASAQRPTEAASLEVIVVPYGDVSIDGKRIGKSPVSVSLEPGDHVVEASNRNQAFKRRRVSLAVGQRRRVVLR